MRSCAKWQNFGYGLSGLGVSEEHDSYYCWKRRKILILAGQILYMMVRMKLRYCISVLEDYKKERVSGSSYGGRFPAVAVSRLQQMRGNGASAVLIVVYGNWDYDELKPVPDVDFARKRVRSKRLILPIRQRPIRKAVFPVCGALPYARRRQGASAVCCLQPAAWNWKRPAVVIKWTNCFCHNNTDWTL